jgi:hypothetical protein
MFNRIQAKTIDAGFVDIPFTPTFYLIAHIRMIIIHVGIHQVIIIAIFRVNLGIFGPAFRGAFNHINRFFIIFFVKIGAGKMGPIPLKFGVLALSPGKDKFCPAFNLIVI